MDIDGDGILSMYELDYFYQEQVHKMEIYGIEYMPFEDCICQVGMHENDFCLNYLLNLSRCLIWLNLKTKIKYV